MERIQRTGAPFVVETHFYDEEHRLVREFHGFKYGTRFGVAIGQPLHGTIEEWTHYTYRDDVIHREISINAGDTGVDQIAITADDDAMSLSDSLDLLSDGPMAFRDHSWKVVASGIVTKRHRFIGIFSHLVCLSTAMHW